MNLKKEVEEHGWALVKGVFSKEEVEDIKKKGLVHKENTDIICNEDLNYLVFDERILKPVKEVLGDNPVYFCDGSVVTTMKEEPGYPHKDSVDRHNPGGPDWVRTDYSIIRVAIYLQNHKDYSGGVTVRDGSHRFISVKKGKFVNVPSDVGDIVIWYLTTTHSAFAQRLSLLPSFTLHPKIVRYIPNVFLQKSVLPRTGIFLTYGKEDFHLERYLRYMLTRRYAVERWQTTMLAPEILKKSEISGLKLMDMREKALQVDLSETNVGFKQVNV